EADRAEQGRCEQAQALRGGSILEQEKCRLDRFWPQPAAPASMASPHEHHLSRFGPSNHRSRSHRRVSTAPAPLRPCPAYGIMQLAARASSVQMSAMKKTDIRAVFSHS